MWPGPRSWKSVAALNAPFSIQVREVREQPRQAPLALRPRVAGDRLVVRPCQRVPAFGADRHERVEDDRIPDRPRSDREDGRHDDGHAHRHRLATIRPAGGQDGEHGGHQQQRAQRLGQGGEPAQHARGYRPPQGVRGFAQSQKRRAEAEQENEEERLRHDSGPDDDERREDGRDDQRDERDSRAPRLVADQRDQRDRRHAEERLNHPARVDGVLCARDRTDRAQEERVERRPERGRPAARGVPRTRVVELGDRARVPVVVEGVADQRIRARRDHERESQREREPEHRKDDQPRPLLDERPDPVHDPPHGRQDIASRAAWAPGSGRSRARTGDLLLVRQAL